jgi:SAM-dependent methyltransferase
MTTPGSHETAYQASEIAEILPVTAFASADFCDILAIPKSLSNKTVLDVGSGCSDLVSWTSKRGATAYGVDIGYTDYPELIDKSQLFLDLCRSNFDPTGRGFVKDSVRARKRFQSDFQANPGHYIAASGENLPFNDASFEHVFSHNFLASEAAMYPEFLGRCLSEALRVLKPKGTLHIGTLNPNGQSDYLLDKEFLESKSNINTALERAKETRIVSKLARLTVYGNARVFVATKFPDNR